MNFFGKAMLHRVCSVFELENWSDKNIRMEVKGVTARSGEKKMEMFNCSGWDYTVERNTPI